MRRDNACMEATHLQRANWRKREEDARWQERTDEQLRALVHKEREQARAFGPVAERARLELARRGKS